jgi:hypothetical protein
VPRKVVHSFICFQIKYTIFVQTGLEMDSACRTTHTSD